MAVRARPEAARRPRPDPDAPADAQRRHALQRGLAGMLGARAPGGWACAATATVATTAAPALARDPPARVDAAVPSLDPATDPAAGLPPDALPWPEPRPLADGLWLWPGTGGEMDARNGGRTAHAVFVVGATGVLVVDSGSAWRHGRALLQAVRRTTDRPLRGLWLSQARQEFVFGAAALQDAGVPVLMGRRAARLMAGRCEGCLRTLRREAGADWMAGTRLVRPDRLLDDRAHDPDRPAASTAHRADADATAGTGADGAGGTVSTGATEPGLPDIGRPLRLLALGHASAPGDLVLHDLHSGWLLAGGVVEHRRIPDIQDADLAGWQAALQRLQTLAGPGAGPHRIRGIVPAHGEPGPAAAMLQAQRDYLAALDARARQLARDGVALSAVADAAMADAPAGWDQVDTIHRRNASILFLRHERTLLRE